MTRLAILGAGPHAREIVDIVEALGADGVGYELLGHVVDPAFGEPGALVRDSPILGGFEWLADEGRGVSVVCGVGEPATKREFARRAIAAGATFATLVHPSVLRTARVRLGVGVVIAAGTVLTSDIELADHVHVNIGCTINHDVRVGEFAYLAPAATICGCVTIEEGVYVGAGATVVQNLTVGRHAIVGAGAVVICDVAPETAVAGVPARVLHGDDEARDQSALR